MSDAPEHKRQLRIADARASAVPSTADIYGAKHGIPDDVQAALQNVGRRNRMSEFLCFPPFPLGDFFEVLCSCAWTRLCRPSWLSFPWPTPSFALTSTTFPPSCAEASASLLHLANAQWCRKAVRSSRRNLSPLSPPPLASS